MEEIFLKIQNLMIYNGRNVYSHKPCIRADVHLEEYTDIPTCDIPNFNNLLLEYIPTLSEHKCCRGYRGGFVDRLYEGTYLAHVVEHVCIEIQNILGYDVAFGKARQTEHEDVYSIIFEYQNRSIAEEIVYLSVELANKLCRGVKYIKFQEKIHKLKDMAIKQGLGPSTLAIKTEAQNRGIPVLHLGSGSLLQLGYGCYGKRVQASITENTGCIPVDIACDKDLTKELLSIAGIPVPWGYTAKHLEDILDYADRIGFPVVIKPTHGNQGKGVSLDLTEKDQIIKAFHIAKNYCESVLIEKFIEGKHYRVLVVNGQMVAAAQRIAAHVVGNGKNTLRELIEIENQNPLRGEGHEKPLTKIKIDPVMELLLKKKNIYLDEVPREDEVVYLRENDNLSTGGIAIDVTNQIHPQNAEIAINAANIIGLDVAGVDITTKDIRSPMVTDHGAVIEVNAAPGIRMHHYPTQGRQRNVAKYIVDSLFPQDHPCSIPIVSVTGTNGKTTTTRIIGRILREKGLKVGMTTTDGIYIDDTCIMKGDTTGALSAQAVLMDKRVEVAVFETARGGLIKKGLGYDLADVGIVTNISEDHLGIDNINTLEQLAHVKALVVEAVRKTGYAVLNADDPYCVEIGKNLSSHIIYFSADENNLFLREHMKAGGKAVYLKNNTLCIFDSQNQQELICLTEVPATLGGLLYYNIKNCLAAVAGTYALGVEPSIISKGLQHFNNGSKDNPGRFELYDINEFKVIVDYAHNIEGYREVISVLKKMNYNRLIGVIGVPGDRSETSTVKIGQLCGENFHHVIIKEDQEKRRLNRGEVSKFLKNGCQIANINKENVEVEFCEKKALQKAMLMAQKGDIVIAFYEDYDSMIKTIEETKSLLGNQKETSLMNNA